MSGGSATTIFDDGATGARPGARLGPWELVNPLDTGGRGVVWLGRRADGAYQQDVAIKLIRATHFAGDGTLGRQLVARFEAERRILARMTHPNVARILDGGTTAEGHPYLVMEYVDGVALDAWAKREGLGVPARLALFAKVCDGVQEAHRHLVVHRDLKPDNILVGADGEPRLLDFGIAKGLADTPSADRPETALSAMTPAYASPEQVRAEPLGTASDVYSLGVVLYQLLAGVRPYELGGLRPAEAEHVVCDLRPEPMRSRLERAASLCIARATTRSRSVSMRARRRARSSSGIAARSSIFRIGSGLRSQTTCSASAGRRPPSSYGRTPATSW